MKNSICISVIILLVMTGCGGNRKVGRDDIITVGVKAKYPQ
jgi:hypothetical protein